MIRALTTFVDFWGLDCYTPPPAVMANVRDLTMAFTYAAKTGASGTAGYVPASEVQRAREEALRLREALADHATKFDVLGAYIEAGDGKSLSHEKIFEWAKQARDLATPPAENGEG